MGRVRRCIGRVALTSERSFLRLDIGPKRICLSRIVSTVQKLCRRGLRGLRAKFRVTSRASLLLGKSTSQLVRILRGLLRGTVGCKSNGYVSVSFSRRRSYELVAMEGSKYDLGRRRLVGLFSSFCHKDGINSASNSKLKLCVDQRLVRGVSKRMFTRVGRSSFYTAIIIQGTWYTFGSYLVVSPME